MQESSQEAYSQTVVGEEPAPQWTVEQAIANLQQKDDLGIRYYAAWWLGKFRVREPLAINALIEALEDEADRTELGGYPLRRNAARALGKLGSWEAVPKLISCLNCSDFYVREASAQSLGMLGEPSCIPELIKMLTGGVEVAVRVAGSPHLTQPYEAVIEALGALKATEAITLIQPFLEHSVERVRYSAARAMYQLTGQNEYGDLLVQALNGSDIQLRRIALNDLGSIGYLPAAEAIAQAATESSFKLIALKGLLEYQVSLSGSSTLSDEAIRVMNLMDTLL